MHWDKSWKATRGERIQFWGGRIEREEGRETCTVRPAGACGFGNLYHICHWAEQRRVSGSFHAFLSTLIQPSHFQSRTPVWPDISMVPTGLTLQIAQEILFIPFFRWGNMWKGEPAGPRTPPLVRGLEFKPKSLDVKWHAFSAFWFWERF